MTIALGIIIILVAVALTVLVLMQTGKGKELSGAIAGGSSNSYLGNSKTNDKDKLLVGMFALSMSSVGEKAASLIGAIS